MSNSVFMSRDEATQLASRLQEDSLIGVSLRKEKEALDAFLRQPRCVPGNGPGGGLEHEQHKANYTQLFNAGKFWLITGDTAYRDRVRDTLLDYARIYTTLPYAVPYSPNPPGRLFHQILNEHMWLVFASAGYSCIRDDIGAAERKAIEDGVFHPMVAMFSETYRHHFDIIHNHGIWAVAAVGMAGIALGHAPYVDMAVYGQCGDSLSGGFLAQLTKLLSPDGYYEEGPYYQRFAIQPIFLFAEALQRHRPELDIYQFRERIVLRALLAPLETCFPDGRLMPLNDANRAMSIRSLGFLVGASFAFMRYGHDERLFWLTEQLGAVWADTAGALLSDAWARRESRSAPPAGGSVEFRCGEHGDKGAFGILRMEEGARGAHIVSLNYGAHGLAEHGHFDGLTLACFNRGQEVLGDYGGVRWLNVEPKSGGCYVAENMSWAKQTIAHNTVTVDQRCQHDADGVRAHSDHGQAVYFGTEDADCQYMSGRVENYDPGVSMQRSVLLYRDAQFEAPLLIDLFWLSSETEHQYDYAFHYDGQWVRSDFPLQASAGAAPVLGPDNGYQHLWVVAKGDFAGESGVFGWLMGDSYYSLTTWAGSGAQAICARLGANDPQFNLRSEPAYIVRRRAARQLFASVLETHGKYDPAIELSRDPRGQVERIELIEDGPQASVLRVVTQRGNLLVFAGRGEVPAGTPVQTVVAGHVYQWSGGAAVQREH